MTTGVQDPVILTGPSAAAAFQRIKAAGATTTRLSLNWGSVAPVTRPTGFDETNPSDPAYRWAAFDREVKLAVAAGLQPIVDILGAPRWAQPRRPADAPDAPYEPDPDKYGAFAGAAAARYGGRVPGLPTVRYWEAWNEPNITTFFAPQWSSGHPVSPAWYRAMVNAFAGSVHRVSSKNVVIAGAVAPFRDSLLSDVADWGPLWFMRELLCLDDNLKPTCADRTSFDVWSMHPYTSGGPQHHAVLPNDVSLGDIPKMRATLRAAQRAHHVIAPHGVGMWATEFSWDSAPPDPQAVPMTTLEQWIPEALYRLWQNGVTSLTWFQLVDQPMASSPFQSGLYYAGAVRTARPKPILASFRFPVAVIPQASGVLVWGRTPWSTRAQVTIQTSSGHGWRTIGRLAANRNGIFTGRFHEHELGLRIRATAPKLGTSGIAPVAPVADHFYNPFGTTPPLESK
jgi:hypothetical protein